MRRTVVRVAGVCATEPRLQAAGRSDCTRAVTAASHSQRHALGPCICYEAANSELDGAERPCKS